MEGLHFITLALVVKGTAAHIIVLRTFIGWGRTRGGNDDLASAEWALIEFYFSVRGHKSRRVRNHAQSNVWKVWWNIRIA